MTRRHKKNFASIPGPTLGTGLDPALAWDVRCIYLFMGTGLARTGTNTGNYTTKKNLKRTGRARTLR